MGMKSRGNWATGVCFKKCINRDKKCDDCIRFSMLVPPGKKNKTSKVRRQK